MKTRKHMHALLTVFIALTLCLFISTNALTATTAADNPAPPPPTVSTGTVMNITSNSATIYGDITLNGGASITNYGFYWVPYPGDISDERYASFYMFGRRADPGYGQFSRTISLISNTLYSYRAFASNTYGTNYGRTELFLTKKLTTPTFSDLWATSSSSISATWDRVDGASSYELSRSTSYSGSYVTRYTGSSRSFNDTGLSAGTTYYYRLRAYDGNYSDYSVVWSEATTPSTPSTPGLTVNSSSSITASWNSVTGATRYELSRSTSSSGSYTVVYSSSSTSYTDSGLSTGTTYYYRLRAYNGTYSGYSSVNSITTSPSAPNLSLTVNSSNSITGSWGSVSGATSYELSRSTSSSGSYTVVYTGSSTSYANNSGLFAGTTYYYRVRAYNGTWSDYSTVRNATTSPATPTLSLTVNNSSSITASWGSVSSATSYELSRSTSASGSYTVINTGSVASFTDSGLSAGTTYYYRVRASNGTWSDYSAVRNATTNDILSDDAYLASLSVTPVGLDQVFNSDITSYTVFVPFEVDEITVSVTTRHLEATTIHAGEKFVGNFVQPLETGLNTVTIEVIAQDEITKRIYKIEITRNEPPVKLRLIDLSINSDKGLVSIDPPFDPDEDVFDFTAEVPFEVGSIIITADANDPDAKVYLDRGEIGEVLELNEGENIIKVNVLRGEDHKIYTVKVTRQPNEDELKLKSLSLSSGMLNPRFNPNVISYTVEVSNEVSSIIITAEANDPEAIVALSRGNIGETITLEDGENEFTVFIFKEVLKEYTITVTRLFDEDASKLKRLELSQGELTPEFNPNVLSYTAFVPNDISNIIITAEANDPEAIIFLNRGNIGEETELNEGENEFTVYLFKDGDQKMVYTIIIIRLSAEPGYVEVSNFAQLQAAVNDVSYVTNIIVKDNIAITGAITIPNGKNIIIKSSKDNDFSLTVAGNWRHFNSSRNAALTLENITLDGGKGSSSGGYTRGGIENSGDLTLGTGAVISNCYASNGGGVYNNGVLTINGGEISDNSATGDFGFGGGVYNRGELNINGGKISGNTAKFIGGGIHNGGTLTIIGGEISGNTSSGSSFGNGGGISNTGTLDISDGEINGNTASHFGGGIYSSGGTLIISCEEICGNSAASGGGIWVDNLTKVTASGVTFNGNTASQAYWMTDLADIALHNEKITGTTRFSSSPADNHPFKYAYNNYDISYAKGLKKNPIIDDPVLLVSSVAAKPGGTLDVTYSIKGNTTGFTTFELAIGYNSSIYTPVTITPAGKINDPPNGNIFTSNLSYNNTDVIRVNFASSTKIDGDGSLFTVKYKVNEDALSLDVPLDVDVIKARIGDSSGDFIDIDWKVEPGLLVIGILGDINGDGFLTPEDAMELLQMYVGLRPWTTRALLLGDVNGDGVVDSVDASIILRMVVGG
ncbi:MAG: cadherin-like beta sandwich domain-containing protein [Clostridiales bacterium]|nr:cadherin-like beta sandwich domain-containing protein [Clostridiales bacterium]